MPDISKLAMQMVILFVLVSTWAVTSGWKHQVMNSLEGLRSDEANFILSAKKPIDTSSRAGFYAPASGKDIALAASLAE